MEETIVLHGKTYIKATKAASDAGYTADYVGQLCRGGKIDAKLIGRSWYVNLDELAIHKKEKKRASRSKAREQAKRAIEEVRARSATDGVTQRHFEARIRYESDSGDLIPKVRKISVENQSTETLESTRIRTRETTDSNFTIENEGKRIIMSGPVTIIDASEDAIEEDADVTYLKPKIEKRKAAPPPVKRFTERIATASYEIPEDATEVEDFDSKVGTEPSETVKGSELTIEPEVAAGDDFLDKLVAHDAIPAEVPIENKTPQRSSRVVSIFTPVMLLLSLAILVGTIVVEGAWQYSTEELQGEEKVSFETAFVVNAISALEKLKLIF